MGNPDEEEEAAAVEKCLAAVPRVLDKSLKSLPSWCTKSVLEQALLRVCGELDTVRRELATCQKVAPATATPSNSSAQTQLPVATAKPTRFIDTVCMSVREQLGTCSTPGCNLLHPEQCKDIMCVPKRHPKCMLWHTPLPLSAVRERLVIARAEKKKEEKEKKKGPKVPKGAKTMPKKPQASGNGHPGKKSVPSGKNDRQRHLPSKERKTGWGTSHPARFFMPPPANPWPPLPTPAHPTNPVQDRFQSQALAKSQDMDTLRTILAPLANLPDLLARLAPSIF